MIVILLALVFAQERVLLEEGKVERLGQILSEEIKLVDPSPVTVVISNTDDVPDYFLSSHVNKSFRDILKEREKLLCEGSKSSLLSCYSCQQENDKFLFTYEFGKKPEDDKCILVRYAVKVKSEKNQEKVVVSHLQKMGFEVDPKTFSTPMIFEKPPLQINVKMSDKALVLDFLEPEMQSLRASFDSKYIFLQEELKVLWPQYVYVTEQYLKEVGVTKPNLLNTKTSQAITSDDDFVTRIKALDDAIKNITSKEEKACRIFEDRDLLAYTVNAATKEILKQDVKNHWSELYIKDLADTVCGNFYFLERLKNHYNNLSSCEAFVASEKVKALKAFLQKNLSVLEKQVASIFLSTLEIKLIHQNTALTETQITKDLAAALANIESLGDGYQSYSAFKKANWKFFKPEVESFRCHL